MRYLNALPRFLLKLPASLRLWIVILCTVGCQTFFILIAPMAQNPSVLAVPVVVAAWIYRKRGTLICLAILTIATWVFYAIRLKMIWLPRSLILTFIIGDVAVLFIGLLISSQRDSFERAEESQRLLARAYEQEQRLHHAKNQFIQNVNHELRTPLTALGGCLELLLEHNDRFDKETRASFLQNAILSCEELQLLVNNVLDSLQTGSNRMEVVLQEVDLTSTIREIIQQVDPRGYLETRIRLGIPANMAIQAHPQYLRQLLRNLLSNTAKYAPGQHPILISARRIDQLSAESPVICISIKDYGPGIPPGEIQHLFGQFTRLQRDTLGQVRGTGLGLYISKQLVEAMGGRIWVESTGVPGEGSCFSFTLHASISPLSTPIFAPREGNLAGQSL